MVIKINLKLFVFIILLFVFKTYQLYFFMIMFGLIHEIGHLLAGIALGLKPQKLTIMPIGVMLEFNETEVSIVKNKELIVSMARSINEFNSNNNWLKYTKHCI